MNDAPNPIQMQKFLSGIDYPASKDDLVSTAEGNGAPDDVLETLRNLSQGSFDSPTDVSSAVSGG
ncbi:MAG: hypothetical protein JWL94_784 [Microbacteriaceae bacterium]|nr:hypothetical protein [Microbacteriaceae bacterium]HEV7956098.1 DUF2795 domain-containing protein [Marisediminicola sp.]